MISRTDVVNSARKTVGTPWSHAGRNPGVAIDCIGVVVCSFQASGMVVNDILHYSRVPGDEDRLIPVLESYGFIRTEDKQPGNVVLMTLGRDSHPSHMGILTSKDTLVHAMNYPSQTNKLFKVKEVIFPGIWERRTSSMWMLKEWQQ